MEKNNISYNTKFSIITKQFLVPSWPKILLHLFVGTLILLLWNARTIWQQFNDSFLTHNTIPGQSASWLEKNFENVLGGRLAQILFWAFAGCFVYVCIWFVINVFTNIRNDIVADEYIHPENYDRKSYWHSVLARKIFLVISAIVLVGFFISALRLLSPLAKLFYSALRDFTLSPSLGEIIGSILAAGFLIYVFVLLVHITVNSWRTVYTDL